MAEKTFAEVAIRIAAVIIAIDYAYSVPALIHITVVSIGQFEGSPEGDRYVWDLTMYLVISGLVIAFVLALWRHPAWIARKLGLAGGDAVVSARYAWLEGSLLTVLGG